VKPSVPWTGFDALLFLAIWLAPLIAGVASVSIASLTQPPVEATVEVATVEAVAVDTQDHGHPVAQLIEQNRNSLVVFLLVFVAVVIVASIIEEFLFRMLFQGWLEAKFRQLQVPGASGIAIVIVSLCFAAIHMGNHGAIDVQSLLVGLVETSLFSLFVFTAGIIYLTEVRGVRVADYLFGTERFFRPWFFTCAGCCLLVIASCFALNLSLTNAFPGTNVAPIAIFFLSLALGVLYSRTQNLSYCILLHACLNGISLTLLWFGSG